MSDALSWAERLATGEPAPEPSALEWAEGLAERGDAGPAAPSSSPNPWTTTPADAAAAAARTDGPTTPFGSAGAAGGGSRPAAPFPAATPGAVDDTPGWGATDDVAPAPAPRSRAELRSRKELRAQETRSSRREATGANPRVSRADTAERRRGSTARPSRSEGPSAPVEAVPAAGAPAGAGIESPFGPGTADAGGSPFGPTADADAAAPARNRKTGRDTGRDAKSGRPGRGERPGRTGRPAKDARAGARLKGRPAGTPEDDEPTTTGPGEPAAAEAGSADDAARPSRKGAAAKPRGTGAAAKPRGKGGTAGPGRRRNVRRILAKGLPKAADRPMVLVIAAVVAVGLGLGVGWTTNYFGSGKNLAAATPQQCAAAQTAWTKAANAQTGLSEENPASLRSGFIDARDAMASANNVPEAIAEDWEHAHTFYATIADAIEKKKPGDAAGIIEAAAAASDDVNTDAMLETSARITRYVNSGCNA